MGYKQQDHFGSPRLHTSSFFDAALKGLIQLSMFVPITAIRLVRFGLQLIKGKFIDLNARCSLLQKRCCFCKVKLWLYEEFMEIRSGGSPLQI